MPKRYPKQARDLAVALYLEGLSVPEITRRFNDGTAGLTTKEDKPLAISITERRVAEYIAEHKAQHGPRPEPEDEELTVDSINRVKQRALNVLAREVAHLEGLPKGRISAKQSTALRQHYATLDDMERRQEIAEKRKSKGKKGTKVAGEKKAESALEALAKESSAQTTGHEEGHPPAPESPETQTQSEKAGDIPVDTERDNAMTDDEFAEFEAKLEEAGHIDPKGSPERRWIERRSELRRGLSEKEISEIMGSAYG